MRPRWILAVLSLYCLFVRVPPRAVAENQVSRLPEVTVTAPTPLPSEPLTQDHVPARVTVITQEDITRSGLTTLQAVLERFLPGAQLSDQQGNATQMDLRYRGFGISPLTGSPQGLSVFVDGVRINDPDADEVNFDLIPLDDVERIEVIPGGGGVFGSNTLAGAVHLFTRRGTLHPETTMTLEAGSWQHWKGHVDTSGLVWLGSSALDYYVGLTQLWEEGWRERSHQRVSRLFSRLGYRAADTDLSLAYTYVNNDLQQPGSLPQSLLEKGQRTTNFTAGDFFQPRLHFLTLNVMHDFSAAWSLSGNGFFRDNAFEQFNANITDLDSRGFHQIRAWGGGLQLTHNTTWAGRAHRLILGVEGARHTASILTLVEGNRFHPLPSPGRDADFDGRRDTVGLYAQETLDLTQALILTASLRADWNRLNQTGRRFRLDADDADQVPSTPVRQTATYTNLSGRFGLNYNPTPQIKTFAVYAHGFRAPEPLEVGCTKPQFPCFLEVGVAADPSLAAEEADSVELGLRSQVMPNVQVSIGGFWTTVSHTIFFVREPGAVRGFFANLGDTRRRGLEFALQLTQGPLRFTSAYTLQDAIFLGSSLLPAPAPGAVQQVHAGNALPLVPNHVGSGVISYALSPTWTVEIEGRTRARSSCLGMKATGDASLLCTGL
ncbi:MAG: TonB-dependent receptor [Deltaproteobacteria bacterium]|nr:TonB-dependent receptor [Deltaproteobacteria bacterium]